MKKIIALVCCLFAGFNSQAQHLMNTESERVFFGSIEAGLNFSTVNGDLRGGFNHVGLNIGTKVFTRLHLQKNFYGSLGLMYTEKGAKTVTTMGSDIGNYLETYNINVNYVQLPIGIHYLHQNRYLFTVGASFNYLVGHNENLIDPFGESIFTDNPKLKFQNTTFDLHLGVGYLFAQHWKVNATYAYGLTPIRLYQNTYGPPLAQADQYSALFQFSLTYLF